MPPSKPTASHGDPLTLTAHGRVELLGNHTDYNSGQALSLAIDPSIQLTSTPRDDARLVLHSVDLGATATYDLAALAPQPDASWSHYSVGVIARLIQLGHPIAGMDITIRSQIPIGSGLSSSAALTAATLATCQHRFGIQLSLEASAKICQWAEHHYAGTPCGLLDQLSILASKKGKINAIDFRDLSLEHLDFPETHSFVIVNTGVTHSLNDGAYDERRSTCHAAAQALGIATLSDIDPSSLEKSKDKLTAQQLSRARHIVGENARVNAAKAALRHGDLPKLGALLFDSHQSSVENFENSCPQLDTLVAYAKTHPDCLGARLTGGGFGGATINLVATRHASDFAQDIAKHYETIHHTTPSTLVTRPAGKAN